MLVCGKLCQRSMQPAALRLQPLALRKFSAALRPVASVEKVGLRSENAVVLNQGRDFRHKAEPPHERVLETVRRELARRETVLMGREEELDRKLRDLALHEVDLRDREGLFHRADPGDVVHSYLTSDHADVAWSLLRRDVLGTNEAYPLESLWCTRGQLRCRLVVHSLGHFVKISLSPAAIGNMVMKAFELSCTLSMFGEQGHAIERLDMNVNEKDWHGNSLVVDIGRCPEHIFVQLQIHKFVALLREGDGRFANPDVAYSATELVPAVPQLAVGENEAEKQVPQPLLIEPGEAVQRQ